MPFKDGFSSAKIFIALFAGLHDRVNIVMDSYLFADWWFEPDKWVGMTFDWYSDLDNVSEVGAEEFKKLALGAYLFKSILH